MSERERDRKRERERERKTDRETEREREREGEKVRVQGMNSVHVPQVSCVPYISITVITRCLPSDLRDC